MTFMLCRWARKLFPSRTKADVRKVFAKANHSAINLKDGFKFVINIFISGARFDKTFLLSNIISAGGWTSNGRQLKQMN